MPNVMVVDNHSVDSSATSLRNEFGSRITLIENSANVGFGAANNQGWRIRTSDFTLLLNADCFVHRDTISTCLEYLLSTSSIGAVACQLRNPDGSIQRSCRRFPSVRDEYLSALLPYALLSHVPWAGGYFMSEWNHQGSRLVEQPAGAFLLMRNEAWGTGPPFDERFFMYYEDVDLCRRIIERGNTILFTDTTAAIHLKEHSTGKVRAAMVPALVTSRYLYFDKWSGRKAARSVVAASLIRSGLRALGSALLSLVPGNARSWSRVRAHWCGVLAAVDLLRGRQ